MKAKNLKHALENIDHGAYKSYKQIKAEYAFSDFLLRIDHVQGDPYADPSRCRIIIKAAQAQIPSHLYASRQSTVALEDYLGRSFSRAIKQVVQGERGDGLSGVMSIASYGQQVLERNTVLVRQGDVELRIRIALPATKRRVDAKQAAIMLFQELPELVALGLLPIKQDLSAIQHHIDTVLEQQALRAQLSARQLVAFIADGSLLPRRSGVDDRPLSPAVAVVAPDSLAVELQRPGGGVIRGLGIAAGVNLIVGGGFHGKSTLLQAIERGVYDHIPGDGREQVVCLSSAVKIRAEDRRAISQVDISPFIDRLPQGKDTRQFSTQDASGSTSQAANIMEALAANSKLLLIDEDTSATNFMIRDQRMQALVNREKEPITPLLHRIDDLKQQNKVALIMVMGGSGDFFSVADSVIMLDNYQVKDVTEQARELAAKISYDKLDLPAIQSGHKRLLQADCLSPVYQGWRERIQPLETRYLRYGRNEVDVSQLEQLVDTAQLKAIGYMLRYYYRQLSLEGIEPVDLVSAMQQVLVEVDSQGLDCLTPYIDGSLAMPRLHELLATINRLRTLQLTTA